MRLNNAPDDGPFQTYGDIRDPIAGVEFGLGISIIIVALLLVATALEAAVAVVVLPLIAKAEAALLH